MAKAGGVTLGRITACADDPQPCGHEGCIGWCAGGDHRLRRSARHAEARRDRRPHATALFAFIRGHYSLKTGVGSGEVGSTGFDRPTFGELTPERKAVKAY
jgi:hypothetical protein